MTHKCPLCGKEFDELYQIESNSQEPYTAVDAFKGLDTYGSILAQKETICHSGHMLHFRFLGTGEERLVKLDKYDPQAIAEAKSHWEQHPQTCEHEGCQNVGMPCYIRWSDTEPAEWCCDEHIYEAGYCRVCGLFNAGLESFDFGGDGLCASCREELRESVEDEYGSFDFY